CCQEAGCQEGCRQESCCQEAGCQEARCQESCRQEACRQEGSASRSSAQGCSGSCRCLKMKNPASAGFFSGCRIAPALFCCDCRSLEGMCRLNGRPAGLPPF